MTLSFVAAPDLGPSSRFVAPHDFIWDTDVPVDLDGHGTHVSGTIGQTTNNGQGVAGVAFNVKLMPVKVLDSAWDTIFGAPNVGTDDSVARGIRYAVDNGARIINMSLGRTGAAGSAPVVEDAIKYAVGKGAFVAIAGGNEFEDGNPTEVIAEIANRIQGAVSVAALDRNHNRAFYSSTGNYIELAAPGGSFRGFDSDGGILQQTLDLDLVETYTMSPARFMPHGSTPSRTSTSPARRWRRPTSPDWRRCSCNRGSPRRRPSKRRSRSSRPTAERPAGTTKLDSARSARARRCAAWGWRNDARTHAPAVPPARNTSRGAVHDCERRFTGRSAACSVPTRASEPDFSARAVGLVTVQGFSAQETFNGIFGNAVGPFWGGGAQIVLRSGIYAEVNASRFRKEGERAFLLNGEATRLGLPLTATITPVEVTGGYRFRLRKYQSIIPYLGAGVGTYDYRETSDSAEDEVSTRHAGILAVGGVDGPAFSGGSESPWTFRYTHIPGILGSGGISEQAKEDDLGGTAARFRIVVGR